MRFSLAEYKFLMALKKDKPCPSGKSWRTRFLKKRNVKRFIREWKRELDLELCFELINQLGAGGVGKFERG